MAPSSINSVSRSSFAKVGRIEELVASGVLAAPLGDAFRGYELFEHQLEAIQLGATGNDFVVTSGTGSGKSLTYISTIFNDIFKFFFSCYFS